MRPRDQRKAVRGINSVLILIATCVLFFFLLGRHVISNSLFLPQASSYVANDSILTVAADDETELAVFWGAAPNARWTVFYFHGNAEDLGDIQPILNNYRLMGLNALSFDYRGYGLSGGKASEKNVYSDARRVLDYAQQNLGVEPDRLILHGRSLGGGVAMELASKGEPAGLILESAFLSVFKVVLPLKWIPGDAFRNDTKAKAVSCPTLIIHGSEDEVIPFHHGQTLSTLLTGSRVTPLWLHGAGHNNLQAPLWSETYWAAIERFVRELE